jgi:hypothetical protein
MLASEFPNCLDPEGVVREHEKGFLAHVKIAWNDAIPDTDAELLELFHDVGYRDGMKHLKAKYGEPPVQIRCCQEFTPEELVEFQALKVKRPQKSRPAAKPAPAKEKPQAGESKAQAIRRLAGEGKSNKEIQTILGVTYQHVYNTLKK